jgi:hypothetical protein
MTIIPWLSGTVTVVYSLPPVCFQSSGTAWGWRLTAFGGSSVRPRNA